jgi:hypothetical protein
VTAKDSQILLAEKRETELRAAKRRQLQEQQAVEADERRRAQIWKGLPSDLGPHPATAMLAAAKGAQPRRRTLLEDTFSSDGFALGDPDRTREYVIHSYQSGGE